MPLKIDQPGTMFGPCVECKHPACKRKRLTRVMLFYMYWNCDIGEIDSAAAD